MRTVALTSAVAGLALLAACSAGGSESATSPADRLGAMPGMRAAVVRDQGVVVDADRGASPEQVAAALRAVAKLEPASARLYLGAGTTEADLEPLDWKGSSVVAADAADASRLGDHADEVAAELVHLADTQGDVTRVVSVSSDLSEVTVALDVPGFPASGAVDAVQAAYAEAIHGWGGVVPEHVAVTAYDRSGETSTKLAGVDATDGTRPLADAAVDLGTIGAGDRTWFPFVTQDAAGVEQLSYAVAVPRKAVDGDPLTRAGNDELWQAVQGGLVPLGFLGAGSTLRVDLVDSSGQSLLGYDPLFSLELGPDGTATAAPDPDGLGWGEAAARAVNAL